jgi:hypothetical protein
MKKTSLTPSGITTCSDCVRPMTEDRPWTMNYYLKMCPDLFDQNSFYAAWFQESLSGVKNLQLFVSPSTTDSKLLKHCVLSLR